MLQCHALKQFHTTMMCNKSELVLNNQFEMGGGYPLPPPPPPNIHKKKSPKEGGGDKKLHIWMSKRATIPMRALLCFLHAYSTPCFCTCDTSPNAPAPSTFTNLYPWYFLSGIPGIHKVVYITQQCKTKNSAWNCGLYLNRGETTRLTDVSLSGCWELYLVDSWRKHFLARKK